MLTVCSWCTGVPVDAASGDCLLIVYRCKCKATPRWEPSSWRRADKSEKWRASSTAPRATQTFFAKSSTHHVDRTVLANSSTKFETGAYYDKVRETT
jgi:hypothetical protein